MMLLGCGNAFARRLAVPWAQRAQIFEHAFEGVGALCVNLQSLVARDDSQLKRRSTRLASRLCLAAVLPPLHF